MSFADSALGVFRNINRRSPVILAGMGVVGVVATAYLAHRAGVRATTSIMTEEEARQRLLTNEEKVRLVWKEYIPVVSAGGATLLFVIGSTVISSKRQAALLGAYAIGDQAFAAYRDKVVEQLGVDEEQVLRDRVVTERAQDVLEDRDEALSLGTTGKAIFIDVLSGQMFASDLETVYSAMNSVNRECAESGYAPMNSFYSYVGGRRTELGEVLGWNTDRMMDLIITRVSKPEEDDAQVYGIDYREQPMMEYHRVF